MKTAFFKSVSLVLLSCILAGNFSGCGEAEEAAEPASAAACETEETVSGVKDYAVSVKLNMASETAKQEVTVKTYVDGDTTHFYVPSSIDPSGVMKVRYIGLNTPESTGKIEEYGKAASEFTKQHLQKAESIILESETDTWNSDATGTRYLCWVWYKNPGEQDYRNLNIEILQNGLAKANSTANNRYGSMAQAALNQAKAQKRNLYSGVQDPDFYYGEAIELDLKELRLHIKDYEGRKVAFRASVFLGGDNSVYVESYDPELDLYFGIPVYYGFNLSGEGMEILSLGNEVRIVGTVQYYEPGDSWQISGLKYRAMKPDDPDNIQKIGEGYQGAYRLTDPETFTRGKLPISSEEGTEERDFCELSMASSVSMENLKVKSIRRTEGPDSASYGAMTMVCQAGQQEITVRTVPLRDENGELIGEDSFLGRTIDIKGVISSFDGQYQIKVCTPKAILIH